MARTWTPAEEAWLAEHYHAGTINDTVGALAREFGTAHTKQAVFVKANKMGLRKDRHYAERSARAQKTMRWSSPKFEREREWMLANDDGESVFGTIDAFEREFGVRLTRSQVSLFRSTYGTGKRVSHGGGKPNKPVGSTREGKDGYLMVKVKEWPDRPCSKDNWRFKHHVVWEQANGCELPKGWTVLFADRDKRNFDPANLVAIPRKYIAQLNNPELPTYCDRDTLMACIALCDLRMAMGRAELQSRTCWACGREFEPRFRTQRTCDGCLEKGIRATQRKRR